MAKKKSPEQPEDFTLETDIAQAAFAHSPARILVAWSPTVAGTEAIEFAAWFARTTAVEIQCVTTLLRPWPAPAITKMGEKYRKWFKKESARLEKSVRAELEKAGIPQQYFSKHVSLLVDGSNETVLLSEAAASFGADIVLLGSTAKAPKGRFRPGTIADSLLHSSTIPLGLAPRAPKLSKRGITRVSFAHVGEGDISSSLHRAAGLASALAVPFRILALSPGEFGSGSVESLELPSDLTLEWRENSLAILDRLSDLIHDTYPELSIETEIGSGMGWNGALDALKWKKGDLLCFGSTPLGTFERVFIGSQTSEILPHVRVPVIMFPA